LDGRSESVENILFDLLLPFDELIFLFLFYSSSVFFGLPFPPGFRGVMSHVIGVISDDWGRREIPPMKRYRRRKCWHCGELFHPDARNLRHQHYCSKPACRKASKAASQRRWLGKAQNRDYFRGAANVQRVRAWRTAHPGYWKRSQRQTPPALQEDSLRQSIDLKGKSPTLTRLALQDLFGDQAVVLIGLIANLTGLAQQDDIVKTGHRLQQLGRDILTGVSGAEGGCDAQTPAGPFPGAPGPPAVQLDRSASGT
jgi:hypothetical protein